MSKIRYHDQVDNRLLDLITVQQAEEFLLRGVARAVRSKGEIVRLYRLPKDRTYANAQQAIGQMRACSNTTRRITNDAGTIIAPPLIREHK